MSGETKIVEYSVTYQDKDLNRFGVIWDVSTELDEDVAAVYVLNSAVRQAEQEDLEVLAMARATKPITRSGEFFDVEYTSAFESIDIYAPLFSGNKE